MSSDKDDGGYAAPDSGDGPPRQLIEDELERILESSAFFASKRLRYFLRFVVEEALAGRADRLQAHNIAVEAFDRDGSFDPQNDPVVRMEAGKLRRRLERYYLTAGSDDPLRIDIPKGGYAPTFAWPASDDHVAAEPSRQPGPSGSQAVPASAEPRADVSRGAATHPSRYPRLVVLPLLNMSGDPDQDYFCAGITEQITMDLARFQDLAVLPLRQDRRDKEKPEDAQSKRRRLGLDYLVRGSVRRSSTRIRVTADLEEIEGGQILWTESYDRELRPDQIFEIQDSIARRVAAIVGSKFGIIGLRESTRAQRKPPDSLDAYDCVLHYYNHAYLQTGDPADHADIRARLERAVEAEPDYGEAWAALAQVYGHEYEFRWNLRSDLATALERFMRTAKRAVKVDPFSASAHAALALAHSSAGDLDAFQKAGDRALELNPNEPEFMARHGGRLAFMGEWDRGLALVERAESLNPHHPGWYNTPVAFYHYHRVDYATALEKTRAIDMPAWVWFHATLAMVHGQLGQTEKARAALRKALEIDPEFRQTFWHVMHNHNCPEPLVEHLADGLRKAGLDLAPGPPQT